MENTNDVQQTPGDVQAAEPQSTQPRETQQQSSAPEADYRPTWMRGEESVHDPNQQPTYTPPDPKDRYDARNFVEKFVEDPDQVLNQYTAPLQQQLQHMEQQMYAYQRNQAGDAISQAEGAIEQHYRNIFNKDRAFVGSETVRGHAENGMRNYMRNAIAKAQHGDYSGLRMMQSPMFAQSILALARTFGGYPLDDIAPISQGNAVVETGSSFGGNAGGGGVVNDSVRQALEWYGASESDYRDALKKRGGS